MQGFLDRAGMLADTIRSAGSACVVSHIDADGISSAAIAVKALGRLGLEPRVRFVKSLGEAEIEEISRMREEIIWICDLGASSCQRMGGMRCVITDHHQLFGGGQARLDLFGEMDHMLNPILFRMSGSTDLSGAGNTYFVARALDPANTDLAYLAVVGAVGDMQDRDARGLKGDLHAQVLEDACRSGSLEVLTNELPFFGWVTRSAAAMLAFSNDLKALGYEDTIREVSDLFYNAGVRLKRTGGSRRREGDPAAMWRSWYELEQNERNIIKATLRGRLGELGLDAAALDRMLGEVYTFPGHAPGSPTLEAKEFATMLNSSGRYILTPDGNGDEERGQLIINVCLKPEVYSESALQNVDMHKVHLREGVGNVGRVVHMDNVQYIGPKGKSYCLKVNDTILGIIAGMVLDQKPGDKGLEMDRDKPVVAFAERSESTEKGKDPEVKVSVRMNRELTKRGINLGNAISQASSKVGGSGGGHDVAAGATIPKKGISRFLTALDEEIGAQMARFSSSK